LTFQLKRIIIKILEIVLKDIQPDYLALETEKKNDREKIEADWEWPQASTGFGQTRGFLSVHMKWLKIRTQAEASVLLHIAAEI
jgi:hypothetical protein